jgi:general secretion pathway protein G
MTKNHSSFFKTKLSFKLESSVRSQLGFTLVEILVVIVIIGILSAIGLGGFIASQQKSRDSQRKGNLKNITTALEVYYNDWGSYPLSENGRILGCGTPQNPEQCLWLEPFVKNDTYYMVEVPKDPLVGYNYFYVSDGTSYQIYARLENLKDKSVPTAAGEPVGYAGTACVGSTLCNYGVASSNSSLAELFIPEGEVSDEVDLEEVDLGDDGGDNQLDPVFD